MVPSLQQYRYVDGADVDPDHPHGDMDRIVWDGEVMPLRGGYTHSVDRNGNPIPRKNIMRGEDITFLLEAYVERLHLGNFVPMVAAPQTIPNETFTRRLDWNTLAKDLPREQEFRLVLGFNALGSKGYWWVPETGLPQTGDYEAPFTLSDAWPGLLLWPERKPMRSQDWTPVNVYHPWSPPGTYFPDQRLLRSRIEAMFENLKLMTSVSCQVCDSGTFIGDSRFTCTCTSKTWTSGSAPRDQPATTETGLRWLYRHAGNSGWEAIYPDGNIGYSYDSVELTSGEAVVVSGLPQHTTITPVYITEGYARMTEDWLSGAYQGSNPSPRGTVLEKTRYYCFVGSAAAVPNTGEFTVNASTLSALKAHMCSMLSGDGYDEDFANDIDNTYRKSCVMEVRLKEIHLIVTLDGHTRWWT